MNVKLTLILILCGISCLNANESKAEESIEKTTKGNATHIYYKGLKVTEPVDFCEQNICLTKCCPFGAEYNVSSKTCVNSTETLDPPIYDEYLRPQSANASDLFHFKIGIIQCNKNQMFRFPMSVFALKVNKQFHLRTDGKLYLEVPVNIPPRLLVNPENYCIDNFKDITNITKVDALVCNVRKVEDGPNYVLTASCMLISCVFILLTVGVYVWLPKLHNVHGRVLIAYLTCLFIGFLLMATIQLLLHFQQATKAVCESITFIIYFTLLSAFFWLNVMCYDIWRVFSGKREVRPQKVLVWLQVRSYAIYAFGVPIVLTIMLIGLEYSGLPLHPWLPLIEFQQCLLSGDSRLLYVYGPILILCVANMTLFALTAVKIAKTRKETSVLSSRDSFRHDQQNDKQTLSLYVKLFILMGISWILEVVSDLYPSKHWIYSDIYNVLIGVFIFIIFVCKRQIFQLLKEKFVTVT